MVDARLCHDPSALEIQIFRDSECTDIDIEETENNKLTQYEIETFNDCQEIQLGDGFIYMENLCFEQSFNLQFYDDKACTVMSTRTDMESLYTYQWDLCYKRSAEYYMMLKKPNFDEYLAEMEAQQEAAEMQDAPADEVGEQS